MKPDRAPACRKKVCSVIVHLHLNRRPCLLILSYLEQPKTAVFYLFSRYCSNASANVSFTSKGASYSTFVLTMLESITAEI